MVKPQLLSSPLIMIFASFRCNITSGTMKNPATVALFSVLATAALLLVVSTRSRSNLEQPLKPVSSRAAVMSHNAVRSMRSSPAFLQAARSATTTQSRSTRCFAGGEISEVDKDSYHAAIKNAGDKLVLVDFYTDW